jgi:hypothetical protein
VTSIDTTAEPNVGKRLQVLFIGLVPGVVFGLPNILLCTLTLASDDLAFLLILRSTYDLIALYF